MKRKRKEYLKAGAQLIWIVDPDPRDVTVFAGTEKPRTLKGDQVLSGGAVLRGFSVVVSEIFAVLDRAQQPTARRVRVLEQRGGQQPFQLAPNPLYSRPSAIARGPGPHAQTMPAGKTRVSRRADFICGLFARTAAGASLVLRRICYLPIR